MEKRDSDKNKDFAYRPSIYANVGDFDLGSHDILLHLSLGFWSKW